MVKPSNIPLNASAYSARFLINLELSLKCMLLCVCFGLNKQPKKHELYLLCSALLDNMGQMANTVYIGLFSCRLITDTESALFRPVRKCIRGARYSHC